MKVQRVKYINGVFNYVYLLGIENFLSNFLKQNLDIGIGFLFIYLFSFPFQYLCICVLVFFLIRIGFFLFLVKLGEILSLYNGYTLNKTIQF
jgi:hypothetical protein